MHVYALADMLDVPDLKLAAVKKLQSQLEDNWTAASFSGIVKEVYSTTNSRDKKIRDLIIKSALKHHTELCKIEEFKEVLNEFGEFSGGIVMSWSDVTFPDSLGCTCGRRNWVSACRGCGQWKSG
jgi:hypothetical protein